MKELQLFNFEGNQVRTVLIDETPYFVGKDVAIILDYKNTRDALIKHVDKEDKRNEIVKASQLSQNATGFMNVDLITESGVYSLIFGSKMPNAKKFKHWVTSEVLPSIRKHGAYMTPEKIEEALLNPDTIINLAKQLKSEREKRLIAEQKVNELTPKATYYDKVLADKSLVSISIIAKDYGMSGQAMNKTLHELGVIYKQGKTWLLYAKYQKTGWTHSETVMVKKKDGTEKAVLNTKWTQKGRLGLYELLKNNDILPLIEREDVA
ncbi:prophage antirepressor-like protein [Lactobacillus colini]|uniref:Prophage antirepressor-like protein n=1 Tax=Lactobacillus colini TaxID=1819254 RepID=A0ABS4MBD1_9LACO|nr:phage antirepressor [Lactobacillus colini]MBP2056977.1 prophage antirepressor-like protein [Lactobacillus colini]